MSKTVPIRMPEKFLQDLDAWWPGRFESRSEAVRHAVRETMEKEVTA